MKKKTSVKKDVAWDKAEKVLQKARPYIQMHGGDVQLVEIKNGTASLKIYGACVGCSLANATYNEMLGALLTEEVPGIKKVKLVQ
jgi:Fe-S cluster biogenesis protein NfuA